MIVTEMKYSHLWMVFLAIIKSTYSIPINQKSVYMSLVTFSYCKLPFKLKNVGATFQRDMSYAFHDIKHIVQPYLDDLPAHSLRRDDYPTHLRAIFMRCRHYKIRLNPQKCVFCVQSGQLLGFIISNYGICVDPLKVEAIINLPPPSTLRQLQSLQGK